MRRAAILLGLLALAGCEDEGEAGCTAVGCDSGAFVDLSSLPGESVD
jgi:hypothetical protein